MANKKEWFIDDDFWERFIPVIFSEGRLAEAPAAADGIIRLAGLDLYKNKNRRTGPYVLDLC